MTNSEIKSISDEFIWKIPSSPKDGEQLFLFFLKQLTGKAEPTHQTYLDNLKASGWSPTNFLSAYRKEKLCAMTSFFPRSDGFTVEILSPYSSGEIPYASVLDLFSKYFSKKGFKNLQVVLGENNIEEKNFYCKEGKMKVAAEMQRWKKNLILNEPQQKSIKKDYPFFLQPFPQSDFSKKRLEALVRETFSGSQDCYQLVEDQSIPLVKLYQEIGFYRPEFWFLILPRNARDAQPAGVLLLNPLDDKNIELVYVAILQEYRGKGWGRKILKKAFHTCLEHHFSQISLNVSSQNQPAIDIYQKEGFAQENAFLILRRKIS